jgi:hypothetical protein
MPQFGFGRKEQPQSFTTYKRIKKIRRNQRIAHMLNQNATSVV